MVSPIRFINNEQRVYDLNIKSDYTRGSLMCVHISDLHFGAFDPKYQYSILKDQFLSKIKDIGFDVLSINGDLFHHKFMSNSDAVLYASLFISDCVEICKSIDATLIIIAGTEQHDAGQLKLFYHYLDDTSIDIRIIENTRFEYVKGSKILCIPEEYNKGENYYNKILFNSGMYDMVFMHGMIEGAIYQDNIDRLDSKRNPTFIIEDFIKCKGCIISGHVHTPGCFKGYYYYCGSPYRWQFGEEHDKGFLVTLHDLDSGSHYVHFEKIISMKFITLDINDLINQDPDKLISFITQKKKNEGIDYLRLLITRPPTQDHSGNLDIIKKYFRSNNKIKIKDDIDKNINLENNKEIVNKYNKYEYLFDNSLSEYDILSRYINHKKGYMYITSDELLEILTEKY